MTGKKEAEKEKPKENQFVHGQKETKTNIGKQVPIANLINKFCIYKGNQIVSRLSIPQTNKAGNLEKGKAKLNGRKKS